MQTNKKKKKDRINQIKINKDPGTNAKIKTNNMDIVDDEESLKYESSAIYKNSEIKTYSYYYRTLKPVLIDIFLKSYQKVMILLNI